MTETVMEPNRGEILQNAEQLSNDVDESTEPKDKSSTAEIFLSNSYVSLKHQPDDHTHMHDVTQPLPEEHSVNSLTAFAEPFISCPQFHSRLSDYQSRKLDDDVSRIDEHDLSSHALTDVAVVADADAVGGSDIAFGGTSERLMRQIDSLLRDSEFIVLSNRKLALKECELKHTGNSVPEPNFMLEIGPECPEMSANDTGNVTLPYNDVSHKVCESQDAERLSEAELLVDLRIADFFVADDEIVDNLLKLLHHLKEICVPIERECQEHECLSRLQQNEENAQSGGGGHRDALNIHDNQREASSLKTKVNHSEDSIQTSEEEIKQLLLYILKVLEKKQFSSAVELTGFLEGAEQMKVEIDKWFCNQNKTASSNDDEDPAALDSTTLNSTSDIAKSFNDAVVFLRTKLSQIVTHLAERLILWQDFIEIRAELEHELTVEHYLLNSVKTNISHNVTPRTKLEAEHDLNLVEDKLEEYSDKLISLRKCNQLLAELLDQGALSCNEEQTGILADELQDIKDSCLRIRNILSHASISDKMIHTTQMTSEKKDSIHSSYARMENSAGDFDELPIACVLLKMALLLFLIVLLFLFISTFEPCWYRPLNRLRLPVPVHMRHVGTYPPI